MHEEHRPYSKSAPSAARGRAVVRLVLVVTAVFALLGTTSVPASSVPLRPNQGYVGSGSPVPSGQAGPTEGADEPLTAADRDLLIKVRLAGLWEMPAGRKAAEKGVSPRVREVGEMIRSQHRQLDALVVQAAAEVGVPLPDEPERNQKSWLEEMDAASGTQFDYVFVDRLRDAHGKVWPVIASVRVGTRNAVVRQFAEAASDYVLTHIKLLESTGLVDYTSLPVPPAPVTTGNEPKPTDLLLMVGLLSRVPPWLAILLVPLTVLIVMPRLLRLFARRPSKRMPVRQHRSRRRRRAEAYAIREGPPFPLPEAPVRLQPAHRLRTNPRIHL